MTAVTASDSTLVDDQGNIFELLPGSDWRARRLPDRHLVGLNAFTMFDDQYNAQRLVTLTTLN
jgi:hypothetical protein